MTDLVSEGEVVPAPRRCSRHEDTFTQRFLQAPAAVAGLILLTSVVGVALLAPIIAPGQGFSFSNPVLSPPTSSNPMGTDDGGVDMFVAVVQGIRISMTVVASVIAVSSLIGITLGVVAGYAGGVVDEVISRTTELVQSVPRFFLALLVIAMYGPGLNRIILVLSLTSWTFLTRVLRAETLSVKRRPFVEAGRAAGSSGRRLVVRHILPNVIPRASVVIMLMGSRVILIEAGLAFLGLGDPRAPSLGILASNAQDFLRQAWWMSVFPGLAIVVAVLGMNLLSDGLNQALDPRSASGQHRRRDGPRRQRRPSS
jgi:peptide/nickel transport system permease protein